MPIGVQLVKIAKGLSAQQAVDAFVRASADPASITPAERSKVDELEATIEAMFLMAAVDGEVSAAELGQLAASVDAFTATEATEGTPGLRLDTSALLAVLSTKLEADGWNKRLAAVAARLRDAEARALAFRLAAGVAFVDDHVAHAEAAALEAMASALAISADESQEILYDVREALFA